MDKLYTRGGFGCVCALVAVTSHQQGYNERRRAPVPQHRRRWSACQPPSAPSPSQPPGPPLLVFFWCSSGFFWCYRTPQKTEETRRTPEERQKNTRRNARRTQKNPEGEEHQPPRAVGGDSGSRCRQADKPAPTWSKFGTRQQQAYLGGLVFFSF